MTPAAFWLVTPAALWLGAGLLLAGAEMLVPGVFLLPLGVAALGTGGAALLGASLHWQFAWFAALAVGLVGAASLVLRRRGTRDAVNGPASGLVGEACRALAFSGAEGRVAFRDGQWQARLVAGRAEPGDRLRIAGLDGTVLLVVPHEGAER